MTHFDKSQLHTGLFADEVCPYKVEPASEEPAWESTDENYLALVEDYYEISEEDAEAFEAEIRWQQLDAAFRP